MKIKKYTIKSFQEAAIHIVQTYTGIIPDWKLGVSARIETDFSADYNIYALTFEHRNQKVCNLSFFGCGYNPTKALSEFDRAFRVFFELDDQFEDILL